MIAAAVLAGAALAAAMLEGKAARLLRASRRPLDRFRRETQKKKPARRDFACRGVARDDESVWSIVTWSYYPIPTYQRVASHTNSSPAIEAREVSLTPGLSLAIRSVSVAKR